MYVPAHFKEDRVAVLHDAIRTYGFGTLVTSGEQELEASHLPLLLDPDPAPLGAVLGHLARANPQWQRDRKSTRLNSSHSSISYAVFCLKKKTQNNSSGCDQNIDADDEFTVSLLYDF